MTKTYFLTGTDTEIGKTFASCALLHAGQAHGLRCVGYKPVAAGAEWMDGQWSNEDARRIQSASSAGFSLAEINPVCLREAIAPHLAANVEGRTIMLAPIQHGLAQLQARADLVVVEGVGGFRVPLAADLDSAELAVVLDLPVILVVGLRLGCINHALLTAEAITARHLCLAGWIGNTLQPTMNRLQENLQTLHELLPAPCLGILPHIQSGNPAEAAALLSLP